MAFRQIWRYLDVYPTVLRGTDFDFDQGCALSTTDENNDRSTGMVKLLIAKIATSTEGSIPKRSQSVINIIVIVATAGLG